MGSHQSTLGYVGVEEHPCVRPAAAVDGCAMGHHCLWRERPGPHFQDWKCEENESGIEGWPLQDGLPHIDKWATSVQHDPRRDGQRNKNLRGHPTVGVRKG